VTTLFFGAPVGYDMAIEFERTVGRATFHDPTEGFTESARPVEYREDPLTGVQSRVVTEYFPAPETDPDLEAYAGDGSDCFFCPGAVEEATPTYPDFVGVDRGSVGEAISFPNLFPYGTHSNVVVLTERHFRPIDDLPAERLADGLACALQYVRAAVEHDGSAFASINMNFLPSSGSSVVHPHLQAVVDDHGTNGMRRRHDAERAYRAEHGERFWTALLDEVRDGPRHVGSTGGVEWVAPFAPTNQYHVRAVTGVDGVPDPDAPAVADLADGIERVLAFYADRGINAFNFALSMVEAAPASRAVLDVVARTPFADQYTNDVFYFQALHDERVVDVAPEEYGPEAAAFF
jgi:galactose-1-phosphate uridylyltransferase